MDGKMGKDIGRGKGEGLVVGKGGRVQGGKRLEGSWCGKGKGGKREGGRG